MAAWCARRQLVPQGWLAAVAAPADTDLAAGLAALDVLDVDQVVSAFEALVADADAAGLGVVFTPSAVAEHMARVLCDRLELGAGDVPPLVADPAAGCGALLAAMLVEVHRRTGAAPSAVAARLTGVDVNASSLRRARILLSLVALDLGDPSDLTLELVAADALFSDQAAGFDGRFDAVIANPPYVRFQELTGDTRDALAGRFEVCSTGNFNLWFAFVEQGWRWLRDGGRMSQIAPNGWLSSLSGAGLRNWMAAHDVLDDIVDFGHVRVFETASTYTAIFHCTNRTPRPEQTFGYVTSSGLDDLTSLGTSWVSTPTATTSGKAPWRLCAPAAAGLIDRIVAAAAGVLDDVAVLRGGVATLRDKLFLLSGERTSDGMLVAAYQGRRFEVEPELTLRCVKVPKVSSAADLAAVRTRIIYPYERTDTGVRALSEEELAGRFPRGFEYLSAVRAELATRDRGRKTYAAWFAYGRTQGLAPVAPKLLTPLYAASPRFVRDVAPDSLFVNGVAVAERDGGPPLEVLEALLGSSLVALWVASTSSSLAGGFFAYSRGVLARIPVPDLDGVTAADVVSMSQLERDRWAAELFGVSVAEIDVALTQLTLPAAA